MLAQPIFKLEQLTTFCTLCQDGATLGTTEYAGAMMASVPLLARRTGLVAQPRMAPQPRMAASQLRVHVAGDPSATETVVFVHGWPDDHTVFEPMLSLPGDDALSESRCVLVDLPRADGAGWVGEDLSFPRLASLVVDTIRSESDGPVTLVGHDWGSVIASLVLRDQPELVSRCVLLDVGAQPRFDTPALAARGLGILAYFTVNTAAFLLGRVGPLRAGE